MGMEKEDAALAALFETLALSAGAEIMRHHAAGVLIEEKADASPVTAADRSAERIILEGLSRAGLGLPCVSEEAAAAGTFPACGDSFLLVDPLDGTREFICGRPDFTVNIALIRAGRPVLGVVHAPAHGLLYAARPGEAVEVTVVGDRAAGRRIIRARPRRAPPVILASRAHCTEATRAFIRRHAAAETISIGSSLKFCMIARGDADLYPRFGPTMQWDTAAGDAILRAAGGAVRTEDGALLTYGPKEGGGPEAFVGPAFIAEGAPA